MSKVNKETEIDVLLESFQNNKELEDELFNILDEVINNKKFLSFESVIEELNRKDREYEKSHKLKKI